MACVAAKERAQRWALGDISGAANTLQTTVCTNLQEGQVVLEVRGVIGSFVEGLAEALGLGLAEAKEKGERRQSFRCEVSTASATLEVRNARPQ